MMDNGNESMGRPRIMASIMSVIGILFGGWIFGMGLSPQALAAPQKESDYLTVESYKTPFGALLEVGGVDFLPDGRLVVSTRRGQVWLVENPLADDILDARFSLFADGLHEGLGLSVVDGVIYVIQRGELSRLLDTDQDGECDRIEVVCDDWGLSGNYHEFAYGLPRDDEGRFYVSLNVAFLSPKWWHGKSDVPYRGWVLRIDPDGTSHPVASGFRSPCGIARNRLGDIFVTDNQGDWMPACPVYHLVEGRFYGHPASLNWTDEFAGDAVPSDTIPQTRERSPAALWLPYKWSRSTGNLISEAHGAFGPFQDQLIIAELTNGLLLRAHLEKVEGEYQGAVMMFRQKTGSAVRLCQADDGTLIIGRTARGWGGQAPNDGLGRLRSKGKVPMEIQKVNIQENGFKLTWTHPLDPSCQPTPEDISALSYDYNYWWEYGSPESNVRPLKITSVQVAEDRKTMDLEVEGLAAGRVARVVLSNIVGQDQVPLLHNEFNYTINRLPGSESRELVAKLVPPPRVRERNQEGWLMLTEGDYREDWAGEGWKAGDPRLADEKTTFEVAEEGAEDSFSESPGVSSKAWVQTQSAAGDSLISRFQHGAIEFKAQFMLAEGARSGIFFQGRYELCLGDFDPEGSLSPEHTGGIAPTANQPGQAPLRDPYKGEGRWHNLDVVFNPPTFNEEGEIVTPARFSRVRINNVLAQENTLVLGPTKGAPMIDEGAMGPLIIRGDSGAVALRRIRMRAVNVTPDDKGFVRIFNGKDLEGWKISDEGQWRVEAGDIVGRGERSHLFSPRDDYQDFEFRAWVKINEIGNSGMYFRVAYGPGWPNGYEAQVNSEYSDPVRTGSLYHLALIKTRLIPSNMWFRQHVICRDTDEGVHIRIFVNDFEVVNFVDKERRHARGHVGFQQHHQGSEVRYRDVEVRELK